MAITLTDRLIDNRLAQGVIAPVRQVWMAGLGAYSLLERKGGERFSALYQHGEEVEAQTLKQAKNVTGELEKRVENIQRGFLSKNLTKLEKAVQKRVIWGLSRLGIPRHKDLQHLARKVEALQQNLDGFVKLDQAERAAKDLQHLVRRVEVLQQNVDELLQLDRTERTAKDIQHLAGKVEVLHQKVDELLQLDRTERTTVVKKIKD